MLGNITRPHWEMIFLIELNKIEVYNNRPLKDLSRYAISIVKLIQTSGLNAGVSAMRSKELVLSGTLRACLRRAFINECKAGANAYMLGNITRQH